MQEKYQRMIADPSGPNRLLIRANGSNLLTAPKRFTARCCKMNKPVPIKFKHRRSFQNETFFPKQRKASAASGGFGRYQLQNGTPPSAFSFSGLIISNSPPMAAIKNYGRWLHPDGSYKDSACAPLLQRPQSPPLRPCRFQPGTPSLQTRETSIVLRNIDFAKSTAGINLFFRIYPAALCFYISERYLLGLLNLESHFRGDKGTDAWEDGNNR